MFGRAHRWIKLLLLLLAASISLLARGQAHWLDKFDGTQACHIVDVVTDAAGNAYVTGDLSGPLTISSGGAAQGNVTTAGALDVLVAKFGPDGALLWVKHAGGPAVDVGLKLAIGPSGLVLTGIFTGTADLFGTAVNAQGGSTDLFVAMLDPADGQAQWVRTAGSPGHTDTPGGITLTSTGQVVVAGKFKGDAVFGSQTLHSAVDPATSLPSFDVFIAAWAVDGTFQWVKQGSGSKDCLAVDVVSSPNDELYVAGQFNDTLTFDVMHPNTLTNNIFVAKFDPQGNELWFRKCGGGNFNQVSDLHWSATNDLLLTGDQSGTMYWSDGSASTPVPSSELHAYFILRANAAGALLDATSLGSSSNVHAASITEQADSVVVFGEFECDFTGLQDAYGADGLFIATGDRDLFITKHAAGDLAFVDAQQFGGRGLKTAGAITSTADGLLFAGAFSAELFLPMGSAFWGDPAPPCSFIRPMTGTFCNDPDYANFAWATGTGPATGFLTKGWVEGRSPYDFWERSDAAPCDRSAPVDPVQIWYAGAEVPDSIIGCAPVILHSHVLFPRGYVGNQCSMNAPTVGPFDHQLWSTGSYHDTAHVAASGWIFYTLISNNGCRTWMDSVYVSVLPSPPLSVSDSTGNYQMVELTLPPLTIAACDPMTFWADPLGPTDQAYWVLGSDTTFNDTVHILSSGTYWLHVISANGCERVGSMVVESFGHINVNITGVNSELAGSDTIHTCEAYCIHGAFTNTWYVDGVPAPLPSGLLLSYTSPGDCSQTGITDTNQPVLWGLQLNGSGWYTVHSDITVFEEACGTVLFSFSFMDSVYVDVADAPVLTFSEDEVFHCTGDTVMIPFNCAGCDSIIWNGPGVVWTSPGGDTVLVNLDGQYSAMALSSSNGSTCMGTFQSIAVTGPPPPGIYMDPPDGVVCTGDSVRLFTDAVGSLYLWTGPGTAFLPDDPGIWVQEPGNYYLSVEIYPGCTVANGPVMVSFFGSPVFSGGSSGMLCPGGTVQLQVQAGPGSVVQWQPPLSGTDPVQTVSEPGTYSCTVLSCGSSWTLYYIVVLSTVSADLGADSFTFCEGGTVTLTAPPGGDSYFWSPSGSTLPQLTVSSAGTVELTVTDSAGCSASSGPVQVVEQTFSQLATASGDSLCAGQTAFVNASGSGELAWYAGADTTVLLANGTSYTFVPSASDTIFLQQTEEGCSGAFVAVPVIVQEPPPTPLITGDSAYCAGDTLLLIAEVGDGAQLFWSVPWGTYAGDSIGPFAASAMHSGVYSCFATLNGCEGDTATVSVVVLDGPNVPVITGDTLLCIGDTLFLQASGSAGSQWQWTTPTGTFSGSLLVVPDVDAADTGFYTCRVVLGSCSSDTAFTFFRLADCTVVPTPGEVPNVITPNGDGVNDVFRFAGAGFVRAELHVYNRWGQQVALVRDRTALWDGHNSFSGEVLSEGVYFYTIEAITEAGEPYHKAGYVQVLR